jgi:predicted aconitase/predicted aconitase with swiveling domain
VLAGSAEGRPLASAEALSFWGGVDPATGLVIDVHHPLHGESVSGRILMMPSSRGSCTGSGVLLDLIMSGRAPAAMVFSQPEDVLTLGALVASEMFDCGLPVVRVTPQAFSLLSRSGIVRIDGESVSGDDVSIPFEAAAEGNLALAAADRAMLEGRDGDAVRRAMRILVAMARQQGAADLVDVTQGHIDGCIYASPANLTFAERMAALGARVRIPTTMNAISVDYDNWREQGVPSSFGGPAQALADAYLRMGCRATFTCSPYLLETAPGEGEMIAWAESNAVVYANSVLAARTAKHPDFLDLCIALTGRAPRAGVYLDEGRKASRIVEISVPEGADDALWPLLGYLVGKAAPDRIPLVEGLGSLGPSTHDLKAFCAAFGTTSAAPMVHIAGVTPEADGAASPEADRVSLSREDLRAAWRALNDGPEEVQLVAIGSPHASMEECRVLAAAMAGRKVHPEVAVIVTAGRQVVAAAREDGTLAALAASRIQLLPDLCWCSISEPVFPRRTAVVLTNSGKYAHYGPGLSGRTIRLGSLADCVEAALAGRVAPREMA